METTEKTSEYKSFMLRLWRTRQADDSGWRASLESPHTGERKGFGSLEALVAYLRQDSDGGPSNSEAEGDL